MSDLSFYANVCNFCKDAKKRMSLIKCKLCNMVSYCSWKHKAEDRERHRDLCCAITYYRLLTKKKGILLSTVNPNMSQWVHSKYRFMTLVENILDRPLIKSEKEIFMFARSCLICHKQEGIIYDCLECVSASFCFDHLGGLTDSEHANQCASLKYCFTLDMHINQPVDMTYIKHISNDQSYDWNDETGMFAFYKKFIHPFVTQTNLPGVLPFAHHSQLATDALTLLYAIHEIHYSVECVLVIYVITCESMDLVTQCTWEILLHFIPTLTRIIIVSIGPNLKDESITYPSLCEKCVSNNKSILYLCSPYTCHFIKEHKPHIVISFNARIHQDKAKRIDLSTYSYTSSIPNWKNIIQTLADAKVGPIILTCCTARDVHENVLTINTILNEKQDFIVKNHNPYLSLRPFRNPENETVLYRNTYLIIYSSFKVK